MSITASCWFLVILVRPQTWLLFISGKDYICFSGFTFSLTLGKKTIEEEFAGTLAPAQSLWTTDAKGAVRLRIDEGCPEEPITVHQMFKASVKKYGSMYALASKKNNNWEKITFLEYYQFCRRAAKSFIKVYYMKRCLLCIQTEY